MKSWLIDTGPIVAYIDSADSRHGSVVPVLESFQGKLLTTAAVVVECMHLTASVRNGPVALLEFIATAGIEVFECTQFDQLRDAVTLMARYHDIPMDFADATLVLLAEATGFHEICTLDRRGFATFRTQKGKRFSLVIQK